VGGADRRNGETRNAYMFLVGKAKEKGPLGRIKHRWVDNIKMDLGQIGLGEVGWIGLAQDRDNWRALAIAAMSFQVP
jgi:hypothetical protein